MADVRKYKYDGKEYDFDAYKKEALNGIDSWLSGYNISDTRKGKIKQATIQLLERMNQDAGSSASLSGINFSDSYAKEKGDWGKNREDSKHYRNATSYLLSRFNQMSPYEEPKPEKTKLSKQIIGDELNSLIQSTSALSDDNKITAQIEGINNLISKYKWDTPDIYDLEEGFDLSTAKTNLDNLKLAIEDRKTFDDDQLGYWRFGVQYNKKPEESNILDQLRNSGHFTEDQLNTLSPHIQSLNWYKEFKKAGMDDESAVRLSGLLLSQIETPNEEKDEEKPKVPEQPKSQQVVKTVSRPGQAISWGKDNSMFKGIADFEGDHNENLKKFLNTRLLKNGVATNITLSQRLTNLLKENPKLFSKYAGVPLLNNSTTKLKGVDNPQALAYKDGEWQWVDAPPKSNPTIQKWKDGGAIRSLRVGEKIEKTGSKKFADVAHGVGAGLDAISMFTGTVPAVGAAITNLAANIADEDVSFGQTLGELGLDALAVIPGVGFLTKSGKLVRTAGKVAKMADKAKVVDRASKIAKAGAQSKKTTKIGKTVAGIKSDLKYLPKKALLSGASKSTSLGVKATKLGVPIASGYIVPSIIDSDYSNATTIVDPIAIPVSNAVSYIGNDLSKIKDLYNIEGWSSGDNYDALQRILAVAAAYRAPKLAAKKRAKGSSTNKQTTPNKKDTKPSGPPKSAEKPVDVSQYLGWKGPIWVKEGGKLNTLKNLRYEVNT